MIRVFVLYDEAPDAERYAEHVVLCQSVPGATFRHGKVFGSPTGAPPHAYYAEFEWPDMDAFKQAAGSPEFRATADDAAAMGKPFSVEFATIE